jgi:hypothetical protein
MLTESGSSVEALDTRSVRSLTVLLGPCSTTISPWNPGTTPPPPSPSTIQEAQRTPDTTVAVGVR